MRKDIYYFTIHFYSFAECIRHNSRKELRSGRLNAHKLGNKVDPEFFGDQGTADL